MFFDFQTTTYGKWVLVGEHAVLRGSAALVFPVLDKQLNLSYQKSSAELNANYSGESGSDMHMLFWSVLEQGIQLLGKSLKDISGRFLIESNIPVGVGMGASAALCVAMARWFDSQTMLENTTIYQFAKELEHLFHGKSSGLDIVGVSTTTGVYFKEGSYKPIKQAWQPVWRLTCCGQIGITSHCIQQVQSIWNQNPEKATLLDKQMSGSVEQALLALEQDNEKSKGLLVSAIEKAADCFEQWGLVSESLQQHMQSLREQGALAVKPTGSGAGGYVISLW